MARPNTVPPKDVRTARSRKGGQAAHTVDAHIKALAAQAPALTAEQRDRLRVLLAPTTSGGA